MTAMGQCGPLISTFPYNEGFESDPAWTSGGVANDWAWGAPAHPIINSAGGGVNSWCVGGLTGQFYEFDAQSWLMSPCFDFSALDNPWISFKIFWEVERTYDGMVLQCSTDQGANWVNVGAYNDPENCFDQNWYNTSNIINLDEANPKHGWSGRQGVTSGSCQGGQGSGGWVTASHCIADLANQPNVRFRFLFGSGSTCNNFDGIGIDDIFIGEPPPVELATSFTCDGSSVSFTADAPCANTILWDFGDPGSGASNAGSGAAAAHTYADPGQYTVTTTVIGPCGPAVVQTLQVTVLGVAITVTNATCGQPNGSLEAVVSGGAGSLVYDWQPGNGTDPVFSGLAAGDYTLAVSGGDMCGATATATVVNAGSTINVQVSHTDVTCGGLSDGTATAQVSGGTATAYAWAPLGGDQATASGLPAGNYTVVVTGDDGCEVTASTTIDEAPVLTVTTTPEVDICAGQSVVLEAAPNGGVAPYTYAWSPGGPDVSPGTTSDYEVVVTDAAGCVSNTAAVTVVVNASVLPALTVDEPVGCTAHCVQFTAGPVGMSAYTFDYGDGTSGSEPLHCYTRPGAFNVTLTVTDDIGCSGTAEFADLVEALPSPRAGFIAPATFLVTDNPLQLVDVSSGAARWLWDFDGGDGNDTLNDPQVAFPEVGCYSVRQVVTNVVGCTDTAQTELCMENEFAIYVPDAFTPNGDGFNEVFGPVTSVRSPSFFVFRVFDRWGAELFTTQDVNEGWSGANAENGIYAWNVELRDSQNKLRKAMGHVVLLR